MLCKYVALFVAELREAEDFYRSVFGMGLLFREAEVEDGWRTLPPDKSWADAESAGVDLAMVALGGDDFVLTLFEGAPRPGTVLEISLGLAPEEIDAVPQRLPETATILEQREHFLRFQDPFGFRWQLQSPTARFRSNGEIAGRWLDV